MRESPKIKIREVKPLPEDLRRRTVAIVNAGGPGSRLAVHGVLPGVPKPMIPLAGHPMISWIVSSLQAAGLRTIISAGHGAEQIQDYFADEFWRLDGKASVDIFTPKENLGTAGDLRQILKSCVVPEEADTLLVLNGDTILDLRELETILAVHIGRVDTGDFLVTSILTPRPEVPNAGAFCLDEHGMVVRNLEARGASREEWAGARASSIGANIFDRQSLTQILREFPGEERLCLFRDVLPIFAGASVAHLLSSEAFFSDLGTEERLGEFLLRHQTLLPELYGFDLPGAEILCPDQVSRISG